MRNRAQTLPALILGLVVALVVAIPWLGVTGYWMRLLSTIGMGIALAQAMNLIVGYAGYPALGNVAFFGFGAYVTAITMTRLHMPFFAAMLLSALLAAAYAAALGLPILRLRGAYFSIATIGVNEATREVVLYFDRLTGGAKGVTLPFFPGDIAAQANFFYFLMFGLAALSTLVVWWISRSRLGYALRALKADEDGARVMGIKTTVARTSAWAISAAITGAVGSAYAYWLSFVEPAPLFDIVFGVKYYIVAILGGVGTIFGPVAGATFFDLLSELIWSKFLSLHMLVLGAAIVVVVSFMPKGIAGLFRRSRGSVAGGGKAA